jgi:putative SOS response-associated peptidase YedK
VPLVFRSGRALDPRSAPRLAWPFVEAVLTRGSGVTVTGLPTFAYSFREKRCLIPADGFFEWVAEGRKKRARHFTLTDRAVFAFAGLWDVWTGEAEKLVTTCMVTTTANELVRLAHDRMPVILAHDRYAEWLDPETTESRLKELLVPYPADRMAERAVGTAVNSPKHDGPDCIEAA